MKRTTAFAAAAAIGGLMLFAPSAPASAQGGCRQTNVGRMFGSLAKRLGQKIAGNEFGQTLSNTIACALSKAEQQRATQTQSTALNSGKTGKSSRKVWSSDEREGVGGGTEVVSRSTEDGQECALQRTFITDVNGDEKSVERRMCQGANGGWAAV